MAQGWGYPVNAAKAHYFEEGEIISLCRRWMFGGVLEDDNHGSPSNCAECKRKRAKLTTTAPSGAMSDG